MWRHEKQTYTVINNDAIVEWALGMGSLHIFAVRKNVFEMRASNLPKTMDFSWKFKKSEQHSPQQFRNIQIFLRVAVQQFQRLRVNFHRKNVKQKKIKCGKNDERKRWWRLAVRTEKDFHSERREKTSFLTSSSSIYKITLIQCHREIDANTFNSDMHIWVHLIIKRN